ncbi:dihydroorotase family protein [Micromonospora sp. NPDC047740]|uniref:dihydroorotase n=1 Tax=Micromonospora sp. NPDC047740 TaxID=3364254 RepID=UPI00371C96E6
MSRLTEGVATADLDLVIRGGRVITAASDGPADIGVRDGRVVQLGERVGPARCEIDATGLLVLPGGIDAHVHFTPVQTAERRLAWADDYASGSRAAAAGGITTVGDIAFTRPGERLLAGLDRIGRAAAEQSLVDFLLHPVLLDPSPERIAELPALAAAGYPSLKIFMHMGDFDSRARDYLSVLTTAGRADLLTLVHCEDGCIIGHLTDQLVQAGHTDLSYFPATRPVASEVAAVERAVAFAEVTGAPIYLVHLSSERALRAATHGRERGVPVHVETRPIYLLFTDERFSGDEPALYVGNPPLRTDADVDALWRGLEQGTISTCCTDHAPWTREAKLDPTLSVARTRPGMADLETLLCSLYSEGVRTGRLSLSRFVEVTSTAAAKLFKLFPRKGTIAVGSDADLVVWDPERRWTVRGAELQTRARMSLLEGRELVGRPVVTIRRGEILMTDGVVRTDVGPGRLQTRLDR